MTYIAPLNLQYIFQNILSGNSLIFTGIFFILISVLAGIFKMPQQVFLILVALSGILLYNWLGGGFYIFIILVVGLLAFEIISRIIKR